MIDQTICYSVELGIVPYRQAWVIQRRLSARRSAGEIPDTLLLLEHPHTYTLGRSANRDNLLIDEAERARRGITLVDVDRGGDITYHGPGQLVIYPILFLGRILADGRLAQTDYVGYLRRLEEVLIKTLARFGITAHHEEAYTGVWVGTAHGIEKIAAMGVHVNAQGISTHGAALNIATDLSYFSGIIPCGIAEHPVTSMHSLLGKNAPTRAVVQTVLIEVFAAVFQRHIQPAVLTDLLPDAAT